MNISYSWLRQYVNTDLSPAEVAGVLTSIGLEVEAIEEVEKIKGGLEGFVIGEVKTCHKHPDADKLSVTTVEIGQSSPLQVVCGAPNVAAGQRVVLATVGTTVYKGSESFKIKKAKIRGVESEGMICAEDELGLGDNHDGIMVLPESAGIGTPARSYFQMESDSMFVIGLTPNRIDASSHIGVARDLAAYLKKDREVQVTPPSVEAFGIDNHSYPVEVIIENPNACRRYTGVTVSGVTVKASPDWLQDRLRSIGMNPINNVVDITNFVLHELGQPLHAFDADLLRGKKIVVKNLAEGTSFVTLDGVERKLSANDLMICDGEGPIAIGGVFGGLHSGVTGETKNIFIESAYFDPVSVRQTSKRHIINTDASFRFERGVDPDSVLTALKRCAILVKEIAGGTIASGIVDVYPNPLFPSNVRAGFANIDRLIGKKLDRKLIRSILVSLDFKILSEDANGFDLEVPMYRVDVTREADVIEEILRIYGYNNVEVSEKLNASLSFTPKPDKDALVDTVSEYLVGNGFNEIMCNSLTRSAYYDELQTFTPEHLVRIKNPLSNELNVMRQTLLFGGLETIQHNANRQHPDLRLFEFGNCYFYKSDKGEQHALPNYSEAFQLAFFVTGRRNEPGWSVKDEEAGFFQLKSYVENVMRKLGVNPDTLQVEPGNDKPDLYAEALVYSRNGLCVAEIARIRQRLQKEFDIRNAVYYAVIHWAPLMQVRGGHKVKHQELPRFPEVRRDLALLLDAQVSFARIHELAFRTERKLLTRVNLFDVYEGDKIEKGKKSYAVSFILQDKEATLRDDRIDKIMQKLTEVFRKELGAELR